MIAFPDISPVLVSINFGGSIGYKMVRNCLYFGLPDRWSFNEVFIEESNLWRYGTPPLEQGQADY